MFLTRIPVLCAVILNALFLLASEPTIETGAIDGNKQLESYIEGLPKNIKPFDVFLSLINEIYLDTDVMGIFEFDKMVIAKKWGIESKRQYLEVTEAIVTLNLLKRHFENHVIELNYKDTKNSINENGDLTNDFQNNDNDFNNELILIKDEQKKYYDSTLSKLKQTLNLLEKKKMNYKKISKNLDGLSPVEYIDNMYLKYNEFANKVIKLYNSEFKNSITNFVFFKYTTLTKELINLLKKKQTESINENENTKNKCEEVLKKKADELSSDEIESLIKIFNFFIEQLNIMFQDKICTSDENKIYTRKETDGILFMFNVLLNNKDKLCLNNSFNELFAAEIKISSKKPSLLSYIMAFIYEGQEKD